MRPARHFDKRGLYAVTPDGWPPRRLEDTVSAVLAGGADWLQYRAKPRPDPGFAGTLLALCRKHDACLIINDDVELASAVGADGVHLGWDDPDPAEARRRLGPRALIGVSCYADLERTRAMSEAGADYLSFGSVFASPTKPDAVRCPLDLLRRARRYSRCVVAIGGIRAENAARVIDAGADRLAVISDLFESPDPAARARQYLELFREHAHES